MNDEAFKVKSGELGMAVQNADEALNRLNATHTDEIKRKEGYATARYEALQELETIEAYGDGVSATLQKRAIDLGESVKSYELFEQGIADGMGDIEHQITMANNKVGRASSDYSFHVSGGNGVPEHLKKELSVKARTKMGHAEKMKYIKQLSPVSNEGLKLFNELCPLV